MRAVVGGNDANVVHGFVKQRHVLLVLDDLDRVEPAGLIERSRNARQMAARLGILVAASQTVHSLGFGLRRVFVSRRRWAASAAATAAPRATCGEIRPIQRADEQALKAAGALQPETLKIRTSAGKSGQRRTGAHWSWSRRAHERTGTRRASSTHRAVARPNQCDVGTSFHRSSLSRRRCAGVPAACLKNPRTPCGRPPE